MSQEAKLNLHRIAGATKSGYDRNVMGVSIGSTRTKRQRPKAKSNFALIKQINNETSDLQRSHPH